MQTLPLGDGAIEAISLCAFLSGEADTGYAQEHLSKQGVLSRAMCLGLADLRLNLGWVVRFLSSTQQSFPSLPVEVLA